MQEESISDQIITSRRATSREGDGYAISLSQRSGPGTVKAKKNNTLIGDRQAKALKFDKSPPLQRASTQKSEPKESEAESYENDEFDEMSMSKSMVGGIGFGLSQPHKKAG